MRDRLIRFLPIYGLIVAVSVLHYTTGVHNHQLHDVYRRLYYLPIILAAFAGGVRGGLVAALVVSVLYYPHAFGHLTHDPGRSLEKILEMVLYFVVAATTGYLVSRGAKTREQLRETAEDLSETLREKERMELELLRAARLAAVGKLSAGLAHEIRNPLTSIKGSAELLQDDFPDGHAKRELLETLIGEADRLNNVLTRFLSFARPLPVSVREFEVREVVEEVTALLGARRGAEETPIRLHEGDEIPTMLGDPEQIRQVLLNILLNAVQASSPGSGIDIRIRRLDDSGKVEILVEDRGPGFDPKALDQLFTPFFTTKHEGTGLGLAISHRIIESHGGRIAASNRPGGGARVSITLPV
ncbi:MAG: ATP-binding protein [Candidatus Eisenbacteria bacterium]